MKKHSIKPLAVTYEIILSQESSWHLTVYLSQKVEISTKESVDLIIKHSKHSQKRAAQRSISYKTLMQVLTFGTPYYRQGMSFYTVLEKDIPRDIDHRIIEKLHNLVVVLGSNGTQIVTCYYNDAPVKYLKRKGKELKKYKRA